MVSPTPDELQFVNQRPRALVIAQRPRLAQYVGYVASPPVNTVLPLVSGVGTVGSNLTTTNGTWTNSPTSYNYGWRRDGVAISGATGAVYALVGADSGANVSSVAQGVNAAGGGAAVASSNAIAVT